MIGPKGKFMLEPEDDRTHLYVSTGTGIAPFISMIRETMAHGAPRRTVLLNGCSFATELGYRDELEAWERTGAPADLHPDDLAANDPRNAGWTGRAGARSRSWPTSATSRACKPDERSSTSAATRR